MNKTDLKCKCCGESGYLVQVPYPAPMSDCYCDSCYQLESIAYQVWRELYPAGTIFTAPFPFLDKKENWPTDMLDKNFQETKEFFQDKFVAKNDLL